MRSRFVYLAILSLSGFVTPVRPKANAREWERCAWHTLWWSCVPVVAVVSVLVGWAFVEPAISDEPLVRGAAQESRR